MENRLIFLYRLQRRLISWGDGEGYTGQPTDGCPGLSRVGWMSLGKSGPSLTSERRDEDGFTSEHKLVDPNHDFQEKPLSVSFA